MGDNLVKVIIFTAGVAVGAAATWKFFDSKYKRIMQEECESEPEEEEEKEKADEMVNRDLVDYSKLVVPYDYSNVLGKKEEPKKTEEKEEAYDVKDPYVISPDEFGDRDYDTVSLDYYADGILVGELDEIIEDQEELIGDGLSHFGEYEDDSVFVRNEYYETDYEILRDNRNYEDVVGPINR